MSAPTTKKPRPRLPAPRIEQLLPLACLASAAVLFASEFLTVFEFAPPDGEPLDEQAAGDRHGYALAVIAAFAFVATFVAVLAGSRPAAVAVGVGGVIALLVFLIVDLPDAGAIGTLEDARQSFFDAEAVPRAGFWLGLAGALGLAVSGIALATLSPDQLSALRPARSASSGERKPDHDDPTLKAGLPSASPNRDGDRESPGRANSSEPDVASQIASPEGESPGRTGTSPAARYQR